MDNEELIDLLRDVNRGIGRYVTEIFAEHDIPITMAIMSRQIANEPGITVSELARRTGIVKSHVSKTIGELEQRGWVEKKADEADQRLLRLYLTPDAKQQLQAARADVRQRTSQLVADIAPEMAQKLVLGLSQIKTALDRVYQGEKK